MKPEQSVAILYGTICPRCEIEVTVKLYDVKKPENLPTTITVVCANCEQEDVTLVRDYTPNPEYADD